MVEGCEGVRVGVLGEGLRCGGDFFGGFSEFTCVIEFEFKAFHGAEGGVNGGDGGIGGIACEFADGLESFF